MKQVKLKELHKASIELKKKIKVEAMGKLGAPTNLPLGLKNTTRAMLGLTKVPRRFWKTTEMRY